MSISLNNWQRGLELQGHKYYQMWQAEIQTKEPGAEGVERTVIVSATKTGSKPLETILLDPALIDNLNRMHASQGLHYFEVDGPSEQDVRDGKLKPKQITE